MAIQVLLAWIFVSIPVTTLADDAASPEAYGLVRVDSVQGWLDANPQYVRAKPAPPAPPVVAEKEPRRRPHPAQLVIWSPHILANQPREQGWHEVDFICPRSGHRWTGREYVDRHGEIREWHHTDTVNRDQSYGHVRAPRTAQEHAMVLRSWALYGGGGPVPGTIACAYGFDGPYDYVPPGPYRPRRYLSWGRQPWRPFGWPYNHYRP